MTWILAIVVLLFGLALSGFFSGAETGLYCVNRLRLHLGVHERQPTALRLSSVLRDEHGALAVTLVGTNLANYVTTVAAAYLLAELMGVGETNAELYTVIAMTPIIFVFGELVPKNLFRLHADTLLARGSRLLVLFDRLFRITGIVWSLKQLAGGLARVMGIERPAGAFEPRRWVARLLQEALAEDLLGEERSDLIERVCQLSETRLHAVMVPRNRVVAIAADADRRELARIVRKARHARLPVLGPGRRHVIGIARVDELLSAVDWEKIGDRAAAALSLSPHDTVATAITRLQRAGRGMGIVADHGGRMLGIVTLKDLLAEVVGGLPGGV